jgi:hypothetical protein
MTSRRAAAAADARDLPCQLVHPPLKLTQRLQLAVEDAHLRGYEENGAEATGEGCGRPTGVPWGAGFGGRKAGGEEGRGAGRRLAAWGGVEGRPARCLFLSHNSSPRHTRPPSGRR